MSSAPTSPDQPADDRAHVVRDLGTRMAAAAAHYGRLREAAIAGIPTASLASEAAAQEGLRTAVIAYADALRRSGAPPERVVIEIKAVVDAALPLGGFERRACVENAVRWAVRAYYRGATPNA